MIRRIPKTALSEYTRTCPHCNHSFNYQQYHSGFGNQGFLYCDTDEVVLTWSSYDQTYQTVIPDTHPWMLDADEQKKVENALLPCPFGGHFSFKNPPRCPRCSGDVSSVVEGGIYFIITGRRIDAEMGEVIWKPMPEEQP